MINTVDARAEHTGTWQGDTGARSCRFGASLPEAFVGFKNTQWRQTERSPYSSGLLLSHEMFCF